MRGLQQAIMSFLSSVEKERKSERATFYTASSPVTLTKYRWVSPLGAHTERRKIGTNAFGQNHSHTSQNGSATERNGRKGGGVLVYYLFGGGGGFFVSRKGDGEGCRRKRSVKRLPCQDRKKVNSPPIIFATDNT
jgi:hypothetical protein